MQGPLKIFYGNSNRELGREICKNLSIKEGLLELYPFKDGEICCRIKENVRGADVFVIQSGSPEPNFQIMELLILIDALKRASASRITAVIPYFPYARQDRKDEPRVPISAKLIANLLESVGVDRILTMDLHVPQIQGFFEIPVDHLYAAHIFVDEIKKLKLKNYCIVSPDVGGVQRSNYIAELLKAPLVIINKKKATPKEANKGVTIEGVIGDIKENCIIIDDIIDGGSSLIESAKELSKKAKNVYAFITHAVLSKDAASCINDCEKIEALYVTDTIYSKDKTDSKSNKIKILSVANIFAKAIEKIHNEESISELFKKKEEKKC